MKHKFIYFTSLFLLMIITGVFWGTWFTLTRSIESFSSEEFVHIGKVIIANVAVPMSVIMPSGILMILLSLWFYTRKNSLGFYSGLLSFVLIIVVLLVTLLVLVPIDNNIKEWTTSTLPEKWEDIRDKWKIFHAIRTFTSLASFACFSFFILTATPKNK